MTEMTAEVLAEVRGQVGFITLNRAKALNALSLGMVRDLLDVLLQWQKDDKVLAVAIRGNGKETDRKFNRMRPSMARVLGLETRSAKEG